MKVSLQKLWAIVGLVWTAAFLLSGSLPYEITYIFMLIGFILSLSVGAVSIGWTIILFLDDRLRIIERFNSIRKARK